MKKLVLLSIIALTLCGCQSVYRICGVAASKAQAEATSQVNDYIDTYFVENIDKDTKLTEAEKAELKNEAANVKKDVDVLLTAYRTKYEKATETKAVVESTEQTNK